QPRLEDEPGHPHGAPPLGRRIRPDDGDGHPRAGGSRDRRPDPIPRRRADRPRARPFGAARGARGDGRDLRRMIRVSLRGLLGRKLRATLTAIAIVLGVAMVSGTFVLTDSIDQAFSSIFTNSRKGSSVVVSGKSPFSIDHQSATTAPTLDESLLPKVRELDGVAEAEGSVQGEAQLIGKDGKAIVYGGAPNLVFSIANGGSVL